MKVHVRSAVLDVVVVEVRQLCDVAKPGGRQLAAWVIVSEKNICDGISLLLGKYYVAPRTSKCSAPEAPTPHFFKVASRRGRSSGQLPSGFGSLRSLPGNKNDLPSLLQILEKRDDRIGRYPDGFVRRLSVDA